MEDDAFETSRRRDVLSWGKVPRSFAAQRTVSYDAFRTFVVLSSYADGETRTCYPSQARLARDLGVSRSVVQRWIDELADHGWVVRRHRMRERKGGWAVNEYLVAPFPQVKSDAHETCVPMGIVGSDVRSDAQQPSVAVGIPMPTIVREDGHSDAQTRARLRAGTDLQGTDLSIEQTLSLLNVQEANVERVEGDQVPDRAEEEQGRELQIREFHRQLEGDRKIQAEQNAWKKLIDDKDYTREEAFLVSARGYVAGKPAWSVYDAAPSAKEWRRELANAS